MSEREPDRPNRQDGRWDPNERVGDVYAVDLGSDGTVEKVEKSPPTPQIWVGSWADYNNGILHGRWMDAARDIEALRADIDAMLAASPTAARTGQPSEDWGVFDFDGFGPARIGEQPTLEYVSLVAQGIAEHGPAFAAFVAHEDGPEVPEDFSERYLGEYESVEQYVDQLIDDLGYEQLLDDLLPDSLRAYVHIDVEALARDMQLGGDIWTADTDDGAVWIFDGR